LKTTITQTNTKSAKKTCDLIQTNGGKNESNIVLCRNRNGHHNTEYRT